MLWVVGWGGKFGTVDLLQDGMFCTLIPTTSMQCLVWGYQEGKRHISLSLSAREK